MANPWFRMYNDFLDDPKLISLAFEDQRHYIGLLALKNLGILDSTDDPKLLNRMVSQRLWIEFGIIEDVKNRLQNAGLITEDWQPAGWDKRQFKSDQDATRAERQKRYRDKKKDGNALRNESSNATVTPLDTDTDTDTEEDTDKEESVASAPQTPPQKKKVMYNDEDMALAVTMHHNITQLTGSKKKVDLEKWANEFRLMREIDKREVSKMDNFLHMLATNEENMWQFWRGNILSPASMRKNYDKVVAQYRRDVVDAGKVVNPNIPLSDRIAALSRTKKEAV